VNSLALGKHHLPSKQMCLFGFFMSLALVQLSWWVHKQKISAFSVKGQEQLKCRVLMKAGFPAGQCSRRQMACTAESRAVWVLSLELQLPESGERIISTWLGFVL